MWTTCWSRSSVLLQQQQSSHQIHYSRSLKVDVVNVFVLRCVSLTSRTFLRVRAKCVRVRQKYTVFGVTHHNTGLTHKKVSLVTETQRKTETLMTSISGLLLKPFVFFSSFFFQDIRTFGVPVFCTSGDVCPRFQSQGRSFAWVLCCLHIMDSSDSHLVRHLLTTWQPAWQPILYSQTFPSSDGIRTHANSVRLNYLADVANYSLHAGNQTVTSRYSTVFRILWLIGLVY